MNRPYDNGALCRRRERGPGPGNGNGTEARPRSLAMVYAPHQKFDSLLEPMDGLGCGTIFRELIKPFLGSGRV